MTAFQIGDKVQASTSAQKMEQGARYIVIDVDEKVTPFGNFVTYQIRPDDGTSNPYGAFWVGNLHVLASKVAQ